MTLVQDEKFHIRYDIACILLLAVAWITMAVLVNPSGEFPLNDDWVYARAVQSIFEKGGFNLSQGPSTPNVFSQAYWGALFCLPYGFSFTALRLSTIILGLVGVLATYWLLRQVQAGRGLSLLGAFLLALNPLYFGLSNTFMTDVPFCALATLSICFLIRGMKRESRKEIIFGILLSYVALLIRQYGIIIPIAFAVAYLCKKGLNKLSVIFAGLPVLSGFLIQFTFQKWLELTGHNSPLLGLQARQVVRALINENVMLAVGFPKRIIFALIYLGVFLAPLLIILARGLFKNWSGRRKAVAIFLIVLFCFLGTVFLAHYHKQLPMVGNVLAEHGLGPVKLRRPTADIIDPGASSLVKTAWSILTAVGIAGALLMCCFTLRGIGRMLRQFRDNEFAGQGWLGVFLLAGIVIYMCPLGINIYFDRYLLPLISLWMAYLIWCVPGSNSGRIYSKSTLSALAVLVTYGVFSLGAAHDYLLWNRIRWQALTLLTEKHHISPHYIDGGLEFNGWHLYRYGYMRRPEVSMWVDKDDYVIALAPLKGFAEINRYSCKRWLPFGVKEIYMLHKIETRE
jgi:4-amino-4-deoxy-L-arabinose transferase-like glycosyltransferase